MQIKYAEKNERKGEWNFVWEEKEKCNRHTMAIVVWTCCVVMKECSHTSIQYTIPTHETSKKSNDISDKVYHCTQVFTKCSVSLGQYLISIKQTHRRMSNKAILLQIDSLFIRCFRKWQALDMIHVINEETNTIGIWLVHELIRTMKEVLCWI